MKIGILTHPLGVNYGGILQAYALQTILERMGHEVVVFDRCRYRHIPIWRFPLVIIKRCIKKYILKQNILVFLEKYYNKAYPIISNNIQSFVDCKVNRYEVSRLKKLAKKQYDCIIVGSDQVWRPMYFNDIADSYLNFAKKWNIKRISYAASFGTEDWEYTKKQTKICAKLAQKFDFISVREDSGIELCEKFLGVHAVRLVDPTLLLEINDYKLLFKSDRKGNNGCIITYILDSNEEKNNIIKNVSDYLSLTYHNLMPSHNFLEEKNINNLEKCTYIPIETWLKYIYEASYVITDSYHGTVFSIIFNKPFITIANKERGLSRFLSLLKTFGLENRLIYSSDDINYSLLETPINYSQINTIKLEEKEKALNYLKQLLL